LIPKHDERLAGTHLRGVDGQRHRETAADQHGRVDAAHGNVELVARRDEGGGVQAAINDVSREHPTEKHDFGDQEQPHP
jgi:hypothetical protein